MPFIRSVRIIANPISLKRDLIAGLTTVISRLTSQETMEPARGRLRALEYPMSSVKGNQRSPYGPTIGVSMAHELVPLTLFTSA